jgi:hypothetical protein
LLASQREERQRDREGGAIVAVSGEGKVDCDVLFVRNKIKQRRQQDSVILFFKKETKRKSWLA